MLLSRVSSCDTCVCCFDFIFCSKICMFDFCNNVLCVNLCVKDSTKVEYLSKLVFGSSSGSGNGRGVGNIGL